MKTLIAFVTLLALAAFVLLALVGCSKYEFNDPSGATAKVVYDHTGTAATVAQQQQQTAHASAAAAKKK
jgi:hypothetical protein